MPSLFPTSSRTPSTTGLFSGQKIWCPLCEDYSVFLRIQNAARLVEVNRRTIYRHLEDGGIHAFRVAGTGYYRVCSACLLAQYPDSAQRNERLKIETQKYKTRKCDICVLTVLRSTSMLRAFHLELSGSSPKKEKFYEEDIQVPFSLSSDIQYAGARRPASCSSGVADRGERWL